MSDAILEVRHLSKAFGNNTVLRDIDFTVRPGDVTSIIGASGSGKSTLLRCINLLETPTGGQVMIEGLDVTLTERAGENGTLFGAVTATEVAAAIKKAGGPSVDRRSVRIEKPIKSVGTHTVGVKLHDAVTAHLKLAVTAA